MKFTLVLLLQLVAVNSCFSNKLEKYEDYCVSKFCLLDAARLIEFASDDEYLQPCDDFREFALGKLFQYRSMHEDFDKSGFLSDTLAHHWRLLKVLKAPIKRDELKVHKIVKNLFKKCTDENYIQHHGKLEVYEFLKDKSMPLIDGARWDPEKVNISALIHHPTMRLEFFITHKVGRCSDPRDPESTIFCWRYDKIFYYLFKTALENSNKTRSDYLKRLKEIDFAITVNDELVNSAVNHLMNFLEDKIELESPRRKQTPIVLKVKDISRVLTPYSNLSIDWLSIINQGFLEHSQVVSDEEEILIDDWQIFAKSIDLIESTPLRNIMDVFFLAFLFRYEHVYSIDQTGFTQGGKREKERFDHCQGLLQKIASPGILSLFVEKYQLKNLEAEKFVKETIEEILAELINEKDLDSVIKDDIERKFRKVKIKFGVMEEVFDASKVEELYEEINLKGDESLFETTIELVKHNNKLNNEHRGSWFFITNQLSQLNSIKYLPDIDLLYIPTLFLLYPYFDNQRPRFLNTATLFPELVLSINEGLKKYLFIEFRLNYSFNYDSIDLAFKNYKKYLSSHGHGDKKLLGFSLPDEKMFWLAFANTYFLRYQTSVANQQKYQIDLQYEHFHVWVKARKEFRNVFQCSELNEKEEGEFESLQGNFTTIYRF